MKIRLERSLKSWKSEDEQRPSKLQHFFLLRRPVYWEEFWRPEETCYHSDSSERPSSNAGGKNFKGVIVIYKALCFDAAQGRMNGAPNEARTHSCRFASLAC